MYKTPFLLTIASLAISLSHAEYVSFGFEDNWQACKGDIVSVVWKGLHNIQETVGRDCYSGDIGSPVEGYLSLGDSRTYTNDELSAAPGERRYFKCSAHCGATANRIEVYCPATVDVNFGFDTTVQACKGDNVKVAWQGEHNIQETKGSNCYSGNIGDEVEGYLDRGDLRTYANNELSAAPGERRYFKCTYHCGSIESRFEVSCPAVNFGFNDNVLACEGDSVTVAWQGYHNIQETVGSACDSDDIGDEVEGYLEAGQQRTYVNDELSAAPGERRYFKCNAHCGATANRIEVYCPAADTTVAPTAVPSAMPTASACVDDPAFKHQEKKRKSCKWIGLKEKRTDKLCKKKKVFDACKIVCGSCCADDATRTFEVEGQELTCDWLSLEARKIEQCTRNKVYSICAAKCGRCCSNDKEFTFNTGNSSNPKLRKCSWFGKKNRAKKWCKQESSIAQACQKSCDSCMDYSISPTK